MKAFVICVCCLVSNVISAQEKKSMKSSQNGKSSPLLWLIINQLDRLDTTIIKIQDKTKARENLITGINTRIDKIQKENSVLNAKVSVLQTDVRKLKDNCENGWKSYGNNCYLFGLNKLKWHNAKEECERRQNHLVTIDSSAENSWLGSEVLITGINDYALWIGVNDLIKEGKWTWISDHSTLGYSNWKRGEPNSGNEHCGEIYKGHSFTWNNAECYQLHGYICEK